jgi:class 3 adenylate cyclase
MRERQPAGRPALAGAAQHPRRRRQADSRGVWRPAGPDDRDGILATFDGPGRGIRCAAAIRDELLSIGIQLRAGLHAGEVELRDSDIGGIAVHIAARVMAAAGPGEILTSQTVCDLVVGSDITLHDHGTQPLKGVEGTWQLFSVAPA